MNKKAINIGSHLIGWLFFLILPLVTLPNLIERYATNNCFLTNYLVLSVPTIGLFYFNYYIAVPRYYFKQKKFAYVMMIILFIVASLVFFIIYFVGFSMACNPGEGSFQELLRVTLPRFIIVFIISFAFRLNAQLKSMEIEKSKAELALLKTQVNPHFLFNVLNNIYGQAVTKSENTADSIAKLSGLMRYSLTETNEAKVALDKELAYLNSYLSLQKLRLTEKTTVEFDVEGNPTLWQVAPMLFMPFIENAFKYGVSNEIQTSIKIYLKITQKEVAFRVENEILPDKVKASNSNQIGIKNVKNRLAITYGNRHELNIKEVNNNYLVNLKIFA